jgi:hypothetical protein
VKPIRWFVLFVALPFALLLAPAARAALPDEIQIYTDDINAPGEWGLELHVNTTPRGNTAQEYPGEIVANRGLRITPELSYGITPTFEAGLYLPLVLNAGNWSLAGVKPRLKWLPIKGDEATGGWYAGANLEISNVQGKFNASRHNAELRIMLGHRSRDWLVGVNPVYSWALSSSQITPPPSNPQFSFNTKVMRRVGEGVSVGLEYYNEKGTWRRFDPSSEQGKTLYAVIEVDNKIVPFHFGIGHGTNGATDRWTVKMIFDLPL